jgi:hypothetical protein
VDKEPIKEGDKVLYYSPSRSRIVEGVVSHVLVDEDFEIDHKFVLLSAFVGKDLENLQVRVRTEWARDLETIEYNYRQRLEDWKKDSEKFESVLTSFTQKG